MDFSFRFDLWLARLPASPRDQGRVEGCVLRPAAGERLVAGEIRVTPEDGVLGDAWARSSDRRDGNQISLINVHLLRAIAHGDEARMPLSGDNLQVDLDLSERNLPTGARLWIGDAVLEITPDPHRPCRSFHERFGADAVKKVTRANRTGRRGRGVMARVLRAGTIRVGDAIRVERPAPVPPS